MNIPTAHGPARPRATARALRAITRGLAATVMALAMTIALLFVGSAPASAFTNDYPYSSQTNASAYDPWGFIERQCTSFAAWRSHQRGRDMHNTTTTPWRDASDWDNEALALGFTVNSRPAVGSFAQWNANEKRTWTSGSGTYWFTAGTHGHVAYVAAVYADGTVLLEDYNGFGGSRVYSTKQLPSNGVPRFIHFAA